MTDTKVHGVTVVLFVVMAVISVSCAALCWIIAMLWASEMDWGWWLVYCALTVAFWSLFVRYIRRLI